MSRERISLTTADHLQSLHALDEVLDLNIFSSTQTALDIGHSRAYISDAAKRENPLLDQDNLALLEYASARFGQRPELTSVNYSTAITVFDRSTRYQDRQERTHVRNALKLRRDELQGTEGQLKQVAEQQKVIPTEPKTEVKPVKRKAQVNRTVKQKTRLSPAEREDRTLERLKVAKPILTAIGWSGAINLFFLADNLNSWADGLIAAGTAAAFSIRHEIKKEIKEIKASQATRKINH